MNSIIEKAIELMLQHDSVLMRIIGVTLKMSFSSSIAALFIGVPLGAFFVMTKFPGKKLLIILNRTLMSMPPVVCGLLCFMAFSGVGPLRHLHLLYTVEGMIIAQILLITPIVAGNTETFLSSLYPDIQETAKGLNLGRIKTFFLTVRESRYQILSTYLLGFSRAIAEVGAVSMVGGAIMHKTNVMTTAIMNYTNQGDFIRAVALGLILMLISLIVNIAVHLLSERLCK